MAVSIYRSIYYLCVHLFSYLSIPYTRGPTAKNDGCSAAPRRLSASGLRGLTSGVGQRPISAASSEGSETGAASGNGRGLGKPMDTVDYQDQNHPFGRLSLKQDL